VREKFGKIHFYKYLEKEWTNCSKNWITVAYVYYKHTHLFIFDITTFIFMTHLIPPRKLRGRGRNVISADVGQDLLQGGLQGAHAGVGMSTSLGLNDGLNAVVHDAEVRAGGWPELFGPKDSALSQSANWSKHGARPIFQPFGPRSFGHPAALTSMSWTTAFSPSLRPILMLIPTAASAP
jgi:hypothetical protein